MSELTAEGQEFVRLRLRMEVMIGVVDRLGEAGCATDETQPKCRDTRGLLIPLTPTS